MKYRIYRIPLRPSSWYFETDEHDEAVAELKAEHARTGESVWCLGPVDCGDVWGYIQSNGELEWFGEVGGIKG